MAETASQRLEGSRRKRRGGPRRKTGCSTCKARHMRCDEKKPVCSNCHRLNLECRASEFISQSTLDPAQPKSAGRQTRAVSSEANAAAVSRRSQDAQDTANVSIITPESTSSSRQNGSWNGPASESDLLSLTEENVYLLTTFRAGVATWMDLFDFNNTYQNDVTRVGTTCPLLLRCICAFTAKHLSMQTSGAVWEPIASRYYVEALNLLIKEIDCIETPTANSLTAAILLSSYEVMAALSAPHRSHYQGALDLIRARKVSASSPGLDGKNFRVYVRHELVVALVNEIPLQLDPDSWQMPALDGCLAEDRLAMHVMWLAGRAVNLVYGYDTCIGRDPLIDELQSWYEMAPSTTRGTTYQDCDEEGFQKVFFAVPAAAAAMLWYHLACIILKDRCRDSTANITIVQDHVNAILGIARSNLPNCVRCFAIMPIYIAGKYSEDITSTFRSWSLLLDIERELGYGTNAMVKALKHIVERKTAST